MMIIKQHRISRKDIKANPDVLYIFGDNLDRKGMGGQAAEMRGEPNSFGIATKRRITHNSVDDYFFDEDEDVIDIINTEFDRLKIALWQRDPKLNWKYKAVVIPLDGIGTGLSKLPETAPELLVYINQKLKDLEKL